MTEEKSDEYVYLPMFYLTPENTWVVMGFQKINKMFCQGGDEE